MTSKQDQKGILYLSVSSFDNAKQLWDSGYPDVLVSYFYIRKALTDYQILIPKIASRGYFMTDSGVFSLLKPYINKKTKKLDFKNHPEVREHTFWTKYLVEYTNWLYENREHVFSCVNMDLDHVVGREIVDIWNEVYFKPLEKYMQVIYIVHKDLEFRYDDLSGNKRYVQYVKEGKKYLGINHVFASEVQRYYLLARKDNIRLHGFALTSFTDTNTFPFFSHDSSSWLSGARYGTTYIGKGERFMVLDSKKKNYRKSQVFTTSEKVALSSYLHDDPYHVNVMNAKNWLVFRERYLKNAQTKLLTEKVIKYLL